MNASSFFLVNTFTHKLLKGNPTPIYVLEKPISKENMLSMASKFNMLVTVFVVKSQKLNIYKIRYFTSTGEIPACGHGTLGAAYILLKRLPDTVTVQLVTIENTIIAANQDNLLTFVQYPRFKKKHTAVNSKINSALGIKAFKTYFICEELESLFIEVETEAELNAVKPDFKNLVDASNEIKEVVVMSKSDSDPFDFSLRSFCPWIGINEDAVTGSIHSVLGHFWQEKLGKNRLVVRQNSERGGKVIIESLDESVKIGGYCEILEGQV